MKDCQQRLKNNYPADLARQMGAEVIIGVTVQGAPKVAEDIGGTMSILSQIIDVNCKNKLDENLAITDLHLQVDTMAGAPFLPFLFYLTVMWKQPCFTSYLI